jgi:hypothetical protein
MLNAEGKMQNYLDAKKLNHKTKHETVCGTVKPPSKMKNLSNHVLKDYAKSERVNRIFIKWEQRAREFRCLDFKTLKAYGRANSRWSALPCWELDKYKSVVSSMSDAELKAITR